MSDTNINSHTFHLRADNHRPFLLPIRLPGNDGLVFLPLPPLSSLLRRESSQSRSGVTSSANSSPLSEDSITNSNDNVTTSESPSSSNTPSPSSHRSSRFRLPPLILRVPSSPSDSSESDSNNEQFIVLEFHSGTSLDSSFHSSNIGDYASDASFDQILQRLMQLHEPKGAPPASQKIIDSLASIQVDQPLIDQQKRCSVCCEDFSVSGESDVVKLPCSHAFDRECVVQWLKQHGTCPICRSQLFESADDKSSTSTEASTVDPSISETTTDDSANIRSEATQAAIESHNNSSDQLSRTSLQPSTTEPSFTSAMDTYPSAIPLTTSSQDTSIVDQSSSEGSTRRSLKRSLDSMEPSNRSSKSKRGEDH